MGGKKIILILIALMAAWAFPCTAQPGMTDTASALPPVEIQSDRLSNYHAGYNVRRIDSVTLMQYKDASLSELLSANGLVYLKKYGVTGIGSISVRGTSNVHTATVWNGFNLQSVMNGGADLSLFPIGFTDQISLQTGGSCALFGSGAIGGSIHINNTPHFGSGLHTMVSTNGGSFHSLGGSAVVEAGTAKTFTSVKGYYRSARNDFRYMFDTWGPFTMQHAAVSEYGVMAGHHLSIKKDQMLSVNLWWQQSEREIPGVFSPTSEALQNDQVMRGSAAWKIIKQRFQLDVRSMLSFENQHYLSELMDIDAENNFLSSITEVESNIFLRHQHMLNVGLSNNYEQVHSTNYLNTTQRNRPSVFLSHSWHLKNNKLKTSLSFREEFSEKMMGPVFSGGLEATLFKGSVLRWSGARVYRIPTMNDLYWNPGGDPSLKPEDGWTVESGLSQTFKIKNFAATLGLTGYSYNISNWILWLPSGSYWTPRNVQTVWSRGLESEVVLNYSIKKWTFHTEGQYSFTRSTNQKSKFPGDASVGKQLIYTPEHRAAGTVRVGWRNFLLTYAHQYTGIRYISSSNYELLQAYHTGDIKLSQHFHMKHVDLGTTFSIDNLWNYQYLVIAGMPMPGRSFKLNITFQFHKLIKQHVK